jgi:hypothetical protein
MMFFIFPPAHFMTNKLKMLQHFSSAFLVIFRPHFYKCCNIFGTNIFSFSYIFKKCWFRQLFFCQHFAKCCNIFQKCWFFCSCGEGPAGDDSARGRLWEAHQHVGRSGWPARVGLQPTEGAPGRDGQQARARAATAEEGRN